MSKKNTFLKIGIPVLILVAGFLIMQLMVFIKAEPEKKDKKNPGVLVETMEAQAVTHQVKVPATGTVEPSREISIIPQVSGKVVWISKKFKTGGFFSRGQLLFRIDDRDYVLAVKQAEAALAGAEYDLALVKSQAAVARQEWEQLGNGTEEANPLVLYEPQLANARASLESAEAALEKAKLDLARTRIRAPFDCRVASKDVDIGQYIRSGVSVGMLTGTRTAEIIVPLPLHEKSWLKVPRNGEQDGSKADIKLKVNSHIYTWSGEVVRSLGKVEEAGRMSRIVVLVDDPYGLKDPSSDNPLLEMGSFVHLTLYGRILKEVIPVSRSHLREENTVWVVSDKNTLIIQPVEVVRLAQDTALIGRGLEAGDLVVTSAISGPARGMKLRLKKEQVEEETEQ